MAHTFSIPKRQYFHSTQVNQPENTNYTTPDNLTLVDETHPQANLISSWVPTGVNDPGPTSNQSLHAPVLDFDFPIEVLPSSQLGHYHLYIHKTISWLNYKGLLIKLREGGLVEDGFVNSSMTRGYTAVRPIGVTKFPPPRGSAILKENAKLRHENFILRQKLEELEAQKNNYEYTLKETSQTTTTTQGPAFV